MYERNRESSYISLFSSVIWQFRDCVKGGIEVSNIFEIFTNFSFKKRVEVKMNGINVRISFIVFLQRKYNTFPFCKMNLSIYFKYGFVFLLLAYHKLSLYLAH